MSKVIYSLIVSLDGYVETADRDLGWSMPDEELHRFFNDEVRSQRVQLYGRRLYELMAGHWPTADANPAAPDYIVEFAQIWKEKPKVVFSRTLREVAWNARLAQSGLAEEIAALKQEADGDLGVGGPTLAAACIRLGLVDEFRLVVQPIVLGGGTPFFPPLEHPVGVRLLETRTFGSGAEYLRYERTGG
jgi:dihydrofolate reductase